MRSSAALAVWLAIGLASSAEAKPSGHLCPKDEDAIDPGPHPNETQLFGCLDKEFELVPVSIKGARRAIAIAGDPTSGAAAFRYHSRKQRNRQITRWWRQLDASAQRYRPSHANLNNWTYQYRQFPSGIVSFAMHRAGAKSGVLCVTKTDGRITPQAITVLNNWCLEWGGFWKPKHRPARS
jgi:hypothetical protein